MGENNLTAILVDDEPEAIKYFCELLEEHKEISLLSTFTDSQEAIIEINKAKPDILFLDVQMPDKTGFDIVKEVRINNYYPHVIFTTGYAKFAIRAIKCAAFDYLLKPVNPFELEAAISKLLLVNKAESNPQKYNKLLDAIEENQPLKFNMSTGFVIIHPLEIIYLEASRNYCEIHITGNRMELVTINMAGVISMLPCNIFHRISRFHTVNLNFIQKIERGKRVCYLMADGEKHTLNISRDDLKSLEKMFTSSIPN